MTDLILWEKIMKSMDKDPFREAVYNDAFDCVRFIGKEDVTQSDVCNTLLIQRLNDITPVAVSNHNYKFAEVIYELRKRCLFYSAPRSFHCFLHAIEYSRPYDKKFYAPRQHYLKPIVQGYQDVMDGKLRLLTVSMPKRAGKSQTEILATLMMSGNYPDRSTLMEGTGDDLVNSFYKGCLEYLQAPSEYHYYDIFPESRLVQTNADTKIVNLVHKSRFPTIMCRSIDARQVGLSEATNMLILDDCVEGREEAKNRQRLDDKWEVISGDIIGRAIEGTPIVATGTRYSLYDPIGHLQEEAQKQGWNWKAIEIPALDPVTDESNYEHIREGKRVFTTDYFREQREMLSAEQFESEFQQQPFEAKGLLFPENSLNRYFQLPVDRDPDSIIAVCDTADKGDDYCAMPIAAVYGNEVYIIDVVFDDSPPEVTKPECAKALIDNQAVAATFESNNAGSYFARDVETILTEKKYVCNIRTKRTISNKQTRIEFASDSILKNFYFKHPSLYARNSQYAGFIKQLVTYTRSGKVPHDDAPDSLSLLENELRGLVGAKVEIFKREF